MKESFSLHLATCDNLNLNLDLLVSVIPTLLFSRHHHQWINLSVFTFHKTMHCGNACMAFTTFCSQVQCSAGWYFFTNYVGPCHLRDSLCQIDVRLLSSICSKPTDHTWRRRLLLLLDLLCCCLFSVFC